MLLASLIDTCYMAVVRGAIIFTISILIVVAETYFMIVQPLLFNIDVKIPEIQYWSIVLPVFVLTFLLASTSAWIGYTMMTTPEPVRFDYEEAYEVAKVEEEESHETN